MQQLEEFSGNNALEHAIEVGKRLGKLIEIEGIPTLVHQNDMRFTTFENLLPAPNKLNGAVTLLDAKSFIDYYNDFSTDHSRIFVDQDNGRFVAVLDYHKSPSEPAWCKHTAVYECPKTKEWNRWNGASGTKMNQTEFALFIEDNLLEITHPSGAAMLEIATSLRAKTKVDFSSATRLDNGQTQFAYQEEVEGKAGIKGQLEIPETIKLKLQPFMGGPAYECEARFRYRINSGQLIMWYDLVRPHRIHEDAVKDVVNQIKQAMRGGSLLLGKSPV